MTTSNESAQFINGGHCYTALSEDQIRALICILTKRLNEGAVELDTVPVYLP